MSSAQLTPEQAKFVLDQAIPTIKTEHQMTKRVIESIPLDKGSYRPDAISKTALELAWHIVASEKRFANAVAAGTFDFTPINRPDAVRNSADIAVWWDESTASIVQQLEKLNGEQLAKIIDFRGILQLPAVTFLRLMMSHTIHHRGQLSMYLRPMGAKVPAIYGESYDTAQARLAKEGNTGQAAV